MKILVCTDGEPHSSGAIEHAIRLGLSHSAEVTALHVIDPWLKKFYDELYAQGRQQYLDYVDERLHEQADEVRGKFETMCRSAGLDASFKIRHGEPLDEILDEVRQSAPDLLITGSKQLGAWGRFRSGNLPSRLQKKIGGQVTIDRR